MTSLVIVETGEVIEQMTKVEAERVTSRIADKLDGIADNLEQVMPLIRDALTRQAWKALGYNGVSAYVEDRFKGALTRLPREVRVPVVQELSAAGMSTRAIAPVVGVTQKTVVKDSQVIPAVSPEPEPDTSDVDHPSGLVRRGPSAEEVAALPKFTPVPNITVGRDGKSYTRPEPTKPRRRPLTEGFRDAALDLDKLVHRIENLVGDDRFPKNRDEVARYANDLIRARDALQGVIERMN